MHWRNRDSMTPPRFTFGSNDRLKGRRAFAAVHGARTRRESGPLLVYALPNDVDHLRLGISIGKRCGNAVRRNRLKRLIREAFRLNRADWPGGYDLMVVIRPHDELTVTDYASHLEDTIGRLDQQWRKRTQKTSESSEDPPPPDS
ncbi:MAG: ribonuclease P protein component [Phycisphaera sp. TMED9]|nr:MAG: ribonuclease P protein component [Phycisphaera sp. TMED9]